MFRYLIPNFTQIGQETWKVRIEANLRPFVKCDFRDADIHLQINRKFCGRLLYRISCKSDEENTYKMSFTPF